MKELDKKEAPGVTGGNVGPLHVPIPILPSPLPIIVPEYPPSPVGVEQPVVEKYLP